jgi:hypothetical protein
VTELLDQDNRVRLAVYAHFIDYRVETPLGGTLKH